MSRNNRKMIYLDSPGTGAFTPLGNLTFREFRDKVRALRASHKVTIKDFGQWVTISIEGL